MPAAVVPRRATVLATYVLATFVLSSVVLAQQVPVRDLPAPIREIDDPFSKIGGGLELHSGQVLVQDDKERQLTLVDFAKGTKTAVGRRGAGPGEYGSMWAFSVLAARGDTIWVYDTSQQRLVGFAPDLTPGRVARFPVVDPQTKLQLAPPFFGDRSNRLYAGAVRVQRAQVVDKWISTMPDSMVVFRTDLNDPSTRAEIATVRYTGDSNTEQKILGENAVKISRGFNGLTLRDAWAVFADGRVAIVRGESYSVEFITPDGKLAAAVRVPYDPIKVTNADRQAEMARVEQADRLRIKEFKRAQPQVHFEYELLPPDTWPATYPPVAERGVLAGPDGHLWVKRMVPARVGREQWDVLDAAGKLVARWRLPTRTSIFAIGLGAVYTVRTDEDDLKYVQRVEVPR